MISDILVYGLCGVIIVSAGAAVYLKSLIAAVISAGVISLTASILYLFMAAPDVAMTEAAIGSGLTSIVFLYTIHLIKKADEAGDD